MLEVFQKKKYLNLLLILRVFLSIQLLFL